MFPSPFLPSLPPYPLSFPPPLSLISIPLPALLPILSSPNTPHPLLPIAPPCSPLHPLPLPFGL